MLLQQSRSRGLRRGRAETLNQKGVRRPEDDMPATANCYYGIGSIKRNSVFRKSKQKLGVELNRLGRRRAPSFGSAMLSALRKRNRSECLFGTFVSLIGVLNVEIGFFCPSPARESIWLENEASLGELLIRIIFLCFRAWRSGNGAVVAAVFGGEDKPRKEEPFFLVRWGVIRLILFFCINIQGRPIFPYLAPSISRHIGPTPFLLSASDTSSAPISHRHHRLENGPSGTGRDCVPPRPPKRKRLI